MKEDTVFPQDSLFHSLGFVHATQPPDLRPLRLQRYYAKLLLEAIAQEQCLKTAIREALRPPELAEASALEQRVLQLLPAL